MKSVEIFTDGACSGNPGPGGWGAILRYKSTEKEISGGEANTTNNRMEITAVIEALALLKEPCEVTLTSDSKYVIDSITKGWVYGWKRNGWVKSDKKTPENLDIIKEFYTHWQKGYRIHMRHVRGHAENKWNNIADKLAVQATNGKEERYVAK